MSIDSFESKSKTSKNSPDFFGSEKVGKVLLHIAPPVMLAQLIQAMYNIVDSFFIGRYSDDGLTALSVIFPIQVLIIALSVGTGVGVNTLMAKRYAQKADEIAHKTAGCGIILVIFTWAIFAIASLLFLRPFAEISVGSQQAADYVVSYGTIVCVGSLGTFLEACFSKIHQAHGNMKLPTIAQIAGAITNITLDPLLIFGIGPVPEMGIAGAAIATVCGQFVAALITGIRGVHKPPKLHNLNAYIRPIYHFAFPSILSQILSVVYIMVLNVILAGISDAGITVLGLYYKLQSFFFIPLFALQTCIVPVLSYNYTRRSFKRCKAIIRDAAGISVALMLIGVFCFEAIPDVLIGLFSQNTEVLEVGTVAIRIIGLSLLPSVIAQLSPTVFQAIGQTNASTLLALTRQIFCLVPIFWAFSFMGLDYTWIAFPIAETITSAVGFYLYAKEIKRWSGMKSPASTTGIIRIRSAA